MTVATKRLQVHLSAKKLTTDSDKGKADLKTETCARHKLVFIYLKNLA